MRLGNEEQCSFSLSNEHWRGELGAAGSAAPFVLCRREVSDIDIAQPTARLLGQKASFLIVFTEPVSLLTGNISCHLFLIFLLF